MLEDRVSDIVSRMTLREPFIATVFTKLERVFDDPRVTTGATDGKRVYFNREFCDKLDNEELLFLCLHDGAHVVWMHMWRRDGRKPDLWNYANDAIINRELIKSGYKMIKGGVLIDWVKDAMDSEYVYAKLLEDPPPQQPQGGMGEGEGQSGAGGFDGQGDLFDAPSEEGRADMEATIMAAAKMAKAAGSGSAFVDRVLKGENRPSVKWSDALREVLNATSRDDYSFRRFNRRLMPQGVYMPSLYSEAMGGLVIGVDTSGSVSERELSQIASEVNAIFEDCRPEFVEVVYCDAKITGTQRFNQGDTVQLKPKGGGGTAFKPVFDHVNQMTDRVAAVVYLTDLMGNVDECTPPECPVVWGVMHTSRTPSVPFGSVVGVHV
jgi:predicted metal-dependent peptidase